MINTTRRSLIALGAAQPLLGRLDWVVAAPPPAKTDTVQLNYNESPYGPSQAAREAIQRAIAGSGRYPYKHMYALAAGDGGEQAGDGAVSGGVCDAGELIRRRATVGAGLLANAVGQLTNR